MEDSRDLIEEIWKDIKGYEGLYQISNFGRVKSFVKKEPKILKCGLTGIGYYTVNLCNAKNRSSKKIHRLVAEAFIPNPNNLPCINHKDGNKLNNYFGNLEWCTSSHNNKEAYRLGLRKPLKGKNNYYSKKLMTKIYQYDLYGNFIKEWESQSSIQRELGFWQQNINKCVHGKRKKAHGYIWKNVKL